MIEGNRKTIWSGEIERTYIEWIRSPSLLSHWADVERFYEFVRACIDDPNSAPDDGIFMDRLKNDMRLEGDAQGFPHPTIEKAGLLYNHLRAFVKGRL